MAVTERSNGSELSGHFMTTPQEFVRRKNTDFGSVLTKLGGTTRESEMGRNGIAGDKDWGLEVNGVHAPAGARLRVGDKAIFVTDAVVLERIEGSDTHLILVNPDVQMGPNGEKYFGAKFKLTDGKVAEVKLLDKDTVSQRQVPAPRSGATLLGKKA